MEGAKRHDPSTTHLGNSGRTGWPGHLSAHGHENKSIYSKSSLKVVNRSRKLGLAMKRCITKPVLPRLIDINKS